MLLLHQNQSKKSEKNFDDTENEGNEDHDADKMTIRKIRNENRNEDIILRDLRIC